MVVFGASRGEFGTWFLLLLLSILWGFSFVFGKILVEQISILTLVYLRIGIAGLTLWSFCAIRGLRFPCRVEIWLAFFRVGLLTNIIPFGLILIGQPHLGAGEAATLIATVPFFTAFMAYFVARDEKVGLVKIIGMVIGFIGVVLVMGPRLSMNPAAQTIFVAQMVMLLAACSYGGGNIFGRYFSRAGIPPLIAATGQITSSWLLLTPLIVVPYVLGGFVTLPLLWEPLRWAPMAVESWHWVLLIGYGTLSTAIPSILFFLLLDRVGAVSTSLVGLMIPVMTVLIGFIFLGERLIEAQIGGMVVLGIGLIIFDGRLLTFFGDRKNL